MSELTARRSEHHPVRLAHLGLGNFHRSHQAWYTQRVNDGGGDWGIAAFSGRGAGIATALTAQDGLYTLIERGAQDSAAIIQSLVVAADGADVERWRATLSSPELVAVTLTITEAGYRNTGLAPDWRQPEVQSDLKLLRSHEAPVTAAGRLVDGLRARRSAGVAPLAIISCDNLPANGRMARAVVIGLAERVDESLAAWIDSDVSFVSSMVDRITPVTTEADRAVARALTGFDDRVPVVAEPFSEWVLERFAGERPRWHDAGARFVDDLTPYERRKLWLLNAGHSLLAYLGLLRGHETVAQAVGDPVCSAALEELWGEARAVLTLEDAEIDAALEALRSRFSNARIEHRLLQIASDGSKKLGPRITDVIAERSAAGLGAGQAELTALAAWARHLADPRRRDPGADSLAAAIAGRAPGEQARSVLAFLAPDLAEQTAVTDGLSTAIAGLATLGR